MIQVESKSRILLTNDAATTRKQIMSDTMVTREEGQRRTVFNKSANWCLWIQNIAYDGPFCGR